jgi:DNA repair exonuclease SbcCD ATPase subunit
VAEGGQRLRTLSPAEAVAAILRAAEDLLDDLEAVAGRLEELLGRLEKDQLRAEEARALLEEARDALELAASRAMTIRNAAAGRACAVEGERVGSCALCGGEHAAELVVHVDIKGSGPATLLILLCERCSQERAAELWGAAERLAARLRSVYLTGGRRVSGGEGGG